MKIIVIGSLNMDLTIGAPQLPEKGMTVTGSGFLATAGGKGANQAVACAKFGTQTHMAGCVGNAFADELRASLSANGVDISHVEQVNGVSSGIAVILVTDGDNRIVLDKGANDKVDNALVERALSEAQAGDILIVQLEIAVETVKYALRLAKQKGMTTILNPAPAVPLSEDTFAYSDYFVPNQTEAQFYTGVFPTDKTSAKSCADSLRMNGSKNIVITLGELGSIGFFGNEQVFVPATRVTALDTTAAGDTYIGVFAGGLCEGMPEEQAMRLASIAAALTVTRRGAQASIPTRDEITAFLTEKGTK